jgi:hypothetical protein
LERIARRKKNVVQTLQRQELQAVGAGIFEIAPQEGKANQARLGSQKSY